MTRPLIFTSLAIAAIRIAGHKSEAFQAVAHLWVGGLSGAYLAGRLEGPNRMRLCGALVVALSMVEVACFVMGMV